MGVGVLQNFLADAVAVLVSSEVELLGTPKNRGLTAWYEKLNLSSKLDLSNLNTRQILGSSDLGWRSTLFSTLFVLDIHTWTFLRMLQEAHTTVTMMATTGVSEFHCVSGGFPCGLYGSPVVCMDIIETNKSPPYPSSAYSIASCFRSRSNCQNYTFKGHLLKVQCIVRIWTSQWL